MRRRACLFGLAALPLLAACSPKPGGKAMPPGSKVLALGDSITHGTGASPGEDWPSLLAARTGWQIENAGVPSDTTAGALQRLPALLEQHRPALVIVELGGNDFLRRRPQAQVKEDLRRILQLIRAQGAQAVLVAVPELSLMALVASRPGDAPIYAELAGEEQVPLVAEVLSEVLGRPEWRADQIHPNAAGYAALADGLAQGLQSLGLLAAP